MYSDLRMVELSPNDINEVMELEQKVCTPLIQASKETIIHRLNWGNIMLGVRVKDILVGSIGFRYGTFLPDDLDSFPKTFREFSTPDERSDSYNACFVYSVNVDPDLRALAVNHPGNRGLRATGVGKALLSGMQDRALVDGCHYLVGDGRPAFYNGSFDYPHERYEQIPHLKKVLDNYTLAAGTPTEQEASALLTYPVFRAYGKALGGGLKVAWVIPNFFPGDIPTGGFRVIVYKQLR